MRFLLLFVTCLTAVVCSTVDGVLECRDVTIISVGKVSPGLEEKTYFAETNDGVEIAVKVYQRTCFNKIVKRRHYTLKGSMHRSTLHIADCNNIVKKTTREDQCKRM